MQMTSSQAPHKRYIYRAHDAARMLLPLPLLTVDSHKMLHKTSTVCPLLLHVVALSSEFAFHAPASVQQQKNKKEGRESREIVIVSA